MKPIVWSYGGGVQSVAIWILIVTNKLPKPDRAVMSNTGRESSLTWQYTEKYITPMMRQAGIELEIAGHELSTVDLYGTKGDVLIPAYTTSGKLPTFCSVEWKKRVVRRYLRSIGYGENNPITMWFGMSLDEVERMAVSDVKWITNQYPLIFDIPKRRHECELLIKDYGLPVPPKSACWMCPHRNQAEWMQQKNEAPEDFQNAIKLEQQMRAIDAGLYLHEQRVTLDKVDWTEPAKEQPELCANFCFI